jgi:hypothetical protein
MPFLNPILNIGLAVLGRNFLDLPQDGSARVAVVVVVVSSSSSSSSSSSVLQVQLNIDVGIMYYGIVHVKLFGMLLGVDIVVLS